MKEEKPEAAPSKANKAKEVQVKEPAPVPAGPSKEDLERELERRRKAARKR